MLSTRFRRAAFSDEESEGRLDGGREPEGIGDAGVDGEGALEVDGSAGFTSAGDEYDRLSDHGAAEALPLLLLGDGGGWTNDFWDQVCTRFKGVLSSSARSCACSTEGVEGGVRAAARTSNWRER